LVSTLSDWRQTQFGNVVGEPEGERDVLSAKALLEELVDLIAGFNPRAEECAQALLGVLPGDELAQRLYKSCKQFDFISAEQHLSALRENLSA